jgi:hypothetical protein|tara:strand:+ start:1874 stop:2224 length:351 start_codon:yes stop_codon:yes gene_type:complete
MKYRSGLEERIAKLFDKEGVSYLYECSKYEYTLTSKYTPDFFLPSGTIIEAKGFFRPSDRRKMLAVKEQHPELDIRFVFMRNNLLSKNSKSTYGDWAEKHGFQWCIYPNIPPDWFQ